jgi:hypothetical protein
VRTAALVGLSSLGTRFHQAILNSFASFAHRYRINGLPTFR